MKLSSKVTYSEVRDAAGAVYFESLFQHEAERFIRDYDSQHGIVLELYEVERTRADHTQN